MMKWISASLLIFSGFLLSCAASDQEATGQIYCEIDQTEIYTIGQDPTTDFNVTNLLKTTAFNSVDCPSVDNEPFAGFIARVKRQGNEIDIVDAELLGGDTAVLKLQTSGTSIVPKDSSITIHDCTIKRFWSGTLNTPANTLTLNEYIVYRGNCQSIFYTDRDRRRI